MQEVVGLLEVRPDGVDLVDEVLDADDAVLPQLPLHMTQLALSASARLQPIKARLDQLVLGDSARGCKVVSDVRASGWEGSEGRPGVALSPGQR